MLDEKHLENRGRLTFRYKIPRGRLYFGLIVNGGDGSLLTADGISKKNVAT